MKTRAYRTLLVFFTISICQVNTHLLAQSFNSVTTNLPDSISASSYDEFNWGDMDNDGDYEAIIHSVSFFGNSKIKNLGPAIYENTDTLQYDSLNIVPCSFSFMDQLLDVDNDNDLDILASNCLMINQGNNTYTNQALNLQLTQFQVADFNNDGLMDILDISNPNQTLNTYTITIYKNEGNYQFSQAYTNTLDILTFLRNPVIEDYDEDGDMDLAFLLDNPDPGANVWSSNNLLGIELLINDQNFSFSTETIMADQIMFSDGTSAKNVEVHQFGIADFDNDGDLDFQASGIKNVQGQQVTSFNVVIGNAITPYIMAELTGFRLCKKALYDDYDADGDMDFMLLGMKQDTELGERREFTIFNNDGSGNFTEIDDQFSLFGVEAGQFTGTPSAADIDYDNDLDIVYTALDNQISYYTQTYLNNAASNSAPSVPTGLSISPDCQAREVLIEWSPASDAESPSFALRYNLRIGTTPGGNDIVSPAALSNGSLLHPERPYSKATQYTLTDVSLTDTLYVSVQSIDPSGAASGFSNELTYFFPDSQFSFDTTGLEAGSSKIALGDYNSDGLLDILSAGYNGPASLGTARQAKTYLYFNNGSGYQSKSGLIPDVPLSYYEQKDYDADGDLDILGMGTNNNNQTVYQIYESDGSSILAGPNGIVPGVNYLKWADLDRDGIQDLIQSHASGGNNPTITVSRLNNGNYVRENSMDINAPEFTEANFVTTDIIHDGVPDLIIFGTDTLGNSKTAIFINSSLSGWQNIGHSLPELNEHSIAKPGDFDNDGDEDLLIVNYNTGSVRFYENDINNDYGNYISIGQFSGTPISADIGDINNDGWIDVALSFDDGDIEYMLFTNNNGTSFNRLCVEPTFTHSDYGLLDLGDADNDGDLDIMISAFDQNNSSNQIYIIRNDYPTANNAPTAPDKLNAVPYCEGVNFTWKEPTDDSTPDDALTYRIKVGSQPGQYDILNTEALASGTSLQPDPGDIRHPYFQWEQTLPPGTYYWTVQAVDNQYVGSAFAAEHILEINTDTAFTYREALGLPKKVVENGRGIHVADYNLDSYPDLLISGKDNQAGTGNDSTYLLTNNGSSFQQIATFPPAYSRISNPWMDVDFDGMPDLILENGLPRDQKMYINNGNGVFSENTTLLENLYNIDLSNQSPDVISSWYPHGNGEFNNYSFYRPRNDSNSPRHVARTFLHNNANDVYAAFPRTSLVSSDFNLDGLRDHVLFWESTAVIGAPIIAIYFTDAPGGAYFQFDHTDVVPVADIGDYNNDGYPDIVIGNYKKNGTPKTVVLTNNNGDSFTEESFNLKGTFNGFVKWGDYNNDGRLDLLCAGASGDSQYHTTLYEQTENGQFAATNCLPAMRNTSGAWVDENQDGKLDFWQTGINESSLNGPTVPATRFFRNKMNIAPNTTPSIPQNLNAAYDPLTHFVTITWDESSDVETPSQSLTYNLRVGKTSGGFEAISPIPGPYSGNTGPAEEWKFMGWPGETYYFAVQAVDQGFQKSSWSQEISFSIPQRPYRTAYKDTVLTNIGPTYADMDADGNLDVVGQDTTRLVELGSDNIQIHFLDQQLNKSQLITFPQEFIGFIPTVLDFNQDGLLDIYYHHGTWNQDIPDNNFIAINQGNRQFNHLNITDLGASKYNSRLKFRDLDNNGTVDIIDINRIYQNDGDSTFGVLQKLPDIEEVVYPETFIDINNDGYQDILGLKPLGDQFNGPAILKILINGGNFNFEQTIDISIDSLAADNIIEMLFNDFTNDGNLDILSRLHHDHWIMYTDLLSGNPTGTILNLPEDFHGVQTGDYDQDGDLDLIGNIGAYRLHIFNTREAFLYLNDGTGNFTPSWSTLFPGFNTDYSSLSDHDHDGIMDILSTDVSMPPPYNYRFGSLLFTENDQGQLNTLPQSPVHLQSVFNADDNTITLSWDQGSDRETPSNSLNYAIRVGTAPGQGDIIMPYALPTGRRTMVKRGNVDLSREYTFKAQPGQPYYWSVQSVDFAWTGSAFAPEQVVSAVFGPNSVTGQIGTSINSGGRTGLQVNGRTARIQEEVPGVTIKLRDVDADQILFSVVSDDNGEFDFPNLPDGNYKLEVDYNGLPMDEDNPVISFENQNKATVTIIIGDEYISYRLGSITALTEKPGNEINIYPNPADQSINISLSDFTDPIPMKAVDMMGRVMFEKVINSARSNLDISQLSAGMYNMIFNGPQGKSIKRFVVK